MKPFLVITKRTLAVVVAVMIIALLVLSRVFAVRETRLDGSTNQKRVLYLQSLGLAVEDSDVSQREIVIPDNFNELYKEYNSLQKKAGFNLSQYKNKTATLYTFPIGNGKEQAHLIVYKGEIIGGDIENINVNGGMKPLKKEKMYEY